MLEPPPFTRRRLLRRATAAGVALAVAGPGGSLLAACGSAATPGSSPDDLGTLRLQVYWLKGAEWAAEYLAVEQGLFRQAGFSGVELLHGGPNVATEAAIAAGKAHLGICLSANFAAAVMQGAPLVAVGTNLQRNPLCVVSLPGRPIRTPQDLVGKRIGVQAISENLWSAFLKLAGIDPGSLTKVPVQHDPAPLTSGQIDGYLAVVHSGALALRLKGHSPEIMMMADFGFRLYEQLFVTTRDELDNHRERTLAALKAELAARAVLADDPQAGVALAQQKYAVEAGQSPDFAREHVQQALALQESDVTKARGRGYFDPAEVAANVRTLSLAGLDIPESHYTTTLLDEIYADGPTIVL